MGERLEKKGGKYQSQDKAWIRTKVKIKTNLFLFSLFTWPGADLWRCEIFTAAHCFTKHKQLNSNSNTCDNNNSNVRGVCCISISICIQGQKKAANGLIKISNYCQIEARFWPTQRKWNVKHICIYITFHLRIYLHTNIHSSVLTCVNFKAKPKPLRTWN